jgi:hypothetical protein
MRYLHLEANKLGRGPRFEVICLETGTRTTGRTLSRAYILQLNKLHAYARRPGPKVPWYWWRRLRWFLGMPDWTKRIPAPVFW